MNKTANATKTGRETDITVSCFCEAATEETAGCAVHRDTNLIFEQEIAS